jgi:anti-sigma-K factor RskA
MPEHPFLEDLPAHALGALSGAERTRLETHLEDGCRPCGAELAAMRRTVELLAYAAPPRAPRAEAKARLLSRVQRDAPGQDAPRRDGEGAPAPVPFPSPRPERRALAWLPLAAAVLLAALTGAGWLGERREVARMTAELAWLKDPRVQIAMLKGLAGTEAGANAKARLVWHPETKRGILYVDGLPPLPLTKSYELWAFVGATPKPAGVFEASASGTSVISLAAFDAAAEKPTKFAVSIEPKGGVRAPTGSVVLLGESF